MTNDELPQMARELNGRGEAYALVTVVRVIAPSSAYLGAQAIVLGDGTLHGYTVGSVAAARRAWSLAPRKAPSRTANRSSCASATTGYIPKRTR